MLRLKNSSNQQQANTQQSQVQNVNREEDYEEDGGANLVNIQKKEKKQEKKQKNMQSAEGWQTVEEPVDQMIAPKQAQPMQTGNKKLFNVNVTKNNGPADAPVIEQEEFPDLDAAINQPKTKKSEKKTAQPAQQQQQQQPQQTQPAGQRSFVNTAKKETTPLTKTTPQPQPEPQPQLQMKTGPVTFKHSNKEEMAKKNESVLQKVQQEEVQQPPAPVQIKTGPVTFKHSNKEEMAKKNESVLQKVQQEEAQQPSVPVQAEQTQTIQPKKDLKLTNSKPKTEQTVQQPSAPVPQPQQQTEAQIQAQLNFRAEARFVNTHKKEDAPQNNVVQYPQPQQQQKDDDDDGWEVVEDKKVKLHVKHHKN